jgi:hypothetical protein
MLQPGGLSPLMLTGTKCKINEAYAFNCNCSTFAAADYLRVAVFTCFPLSPFLPVDMHQSVL